MINFLKIKVLAFEVEEDNENDRKISFFLLLMKKEFKRKREVFMF